MPNLEKDFLLLMEKHSATIHKVSKMYMEKREDREDLFQEILLQLWKSFESFRSESQFSTWMYQVALNTAITYFKKDRKRIDGTNAPITHDQQVYNHNANDDTRLEQFYRAAHSLTRIEKAVLFLFLEGESHQQIGQKLGISAGNARVKLNRTKEKLRQIIKQQEHEY